MITIYLVSWPYHDTEQYVDIDYKLLFQMALYCIPTAPCSSSPNKTCSPISQNDIFCI